MPTIKKPDCVFRCHKCEHEVYVSKKKVAKMLKLDCPECGEEAFENWILVGEGNFDKR
jgi:Zn finger protein HypA/HybF involved in hydrogenase expression